MAEQGAEECSSNFDCLQSQASTNGCDVNENRENHKENIVEDNTNDKSNNGSKKTNDKITLQQNDKVCKELGLRNEMECIVTAMSAMEPIIVKADEQQAYSIEFRNWCLNLKTHLYEAEDMLDNLHALRNLVISQPQDGEVVGDLLRGLDHNQALSCFGTQHGVLT
ncbi:uncharacterized protein [Cicer arietinum]|uniref:Uncharacterized protein LOC101508688 isoform X2 n=1 Tax=Cicer arietinum TaxID=3827 RepID=A0A1S2YJT0_CICAR|nr:uncharacterized protein LOC101508688 isoform X2 [Cicer arietinum]